VPSTADPRTDARVPAALRVRLKLATGDTDVVTDAVSLGGFGTAVRVPIAAGDIVEIALYLPNGAILSAHAECKNSDETHAGFALQFSELDVQAQWRAYIDEQEQEGSLWTLLGKFASTSGDEKEAARAALEKSSIGVLFKRIIPTSSSSASATSATSAAAPRALRFHVVGENGEAYRIAFEKHGGTPPEKSDLVSLPGFKVLAVKVASRVLRQDVIVRKDQKSEPAPVRVVELQRGGYAAVHGGTEGVPVGLVSLAVGEVILVEVDGAPVFPNFDADDLERIALDTFKKDEPQRPKPEPLPREPVGISVASPTEGHDALRAAQDASPRATRKYDERAIDVFPQVWAQATLADGQPVMGPTLRDGEKLLVLILEGPGAPRIAKLEGARNVRVLNVEYR